MKERMKVLYHEDNRQPANTFTRRHAVNTSVCGNVVSIVGSRQHWCAHDDHYQLTVLGPKQFWRKISSVACTYKEGKFYGSIAPFKRTLCEIFHLDWILTNAWTFKILEDRRDLWTACLSGKITNPEKLCKYFSKKYFKGAYSYAILKKMAEKDFHAISLWDLYYYTNNPEASLEAVLKVWDESSNWQLLYDVLQSCKMLNSKMNFKWSQKRLYEEHQKQIEAINLMEIESFSDEPVIKEFNYGGLSLINNERECYKEGCYMHNCVHSCYWGSIKNKRYLIARGNVNGEYLDLGMRVGNSGIIFDQVYTVRNQCVSEATRDYCQQWIKNLEEQLLEVVGISKSPVLESPIENAVGIMPLNLV